MIWTTIWWSFYFQSYNKIRTVIFRNLHVEIWWIDICKCRWYYNCLTCIHVVCDFFFTDWINNLCILSTCINCLHWSGCNFSSIYPLNVAIFKNCVGLDVIYCSIHCGLNPWFSLTFNRKQHGNETRRIRDSPSSLNPSLLNQLIIVSRGEERRGGGAEIFDL